jgi:transposase
MSDRFDMMLERKLDTKPDEGDGAPVGVRRIELITGTARRREWSAGEKTRILLESAEPGANVSDVARRNGLSPQQLFGWRREARALLADAAPPITAASSRTAARAGSGKTKVRGAPAPADAPNFAPVVLLAPEAAPPASPPQPSDKTRGVIEIVIGDAVVRVVGKVDRSALAEVLAVLRRAS